jgi:tetratricopeptide (TPR) repeat protein
VALKKTQALAAIKNYDEALELLTRLENQTASADARVELFTQEGTLRLAKGDAAGAWEAFKKATQLDPQWINLDVEGCENMARAAMLTGNLGPARTYVEFINRNFVHREDDKKIQLGLLFAEIQLRQGDLKNAEDNYASLFSLLRDSPKGLPILKQILDKRPQDLVNGEGHYCMLLWHRGQIPQAMAELDRSYQQCLREGVSHDDLQGPIESIVPSFMEYAVRKSRPFDVVTVWKLYGNIIKTNPLRWRCMIPLAESLERTELPREALTVIDQLKQESRLTAPVLDSPWLKLREARLRIKLGEVQQAIPILEGLLGGCHDAELTAQTYGQLAEAYRLSNRLLEAAQAFQSLANLPGITPTERGNALLQAGDIFMRKGMTVQAIELSLEGLIFEKELLEKSKEPGWDLGTGTALRLQLAKAYAAHADDKRARIVLEDILQRPELLADVKSEARLMLGDSLLKLGRKGEAIRIYQAAVEDGGTAANLWKDAAGQRLKTIDWDRAHPLWKINPNSGS